ncbi:lanthionine synthetase C family protein [Aquimarina sp. 2201CG5-10]|uniref:lanthionine synthetase C family protein n=1 Tax=Aquimarina callyspongiae TaxID=3098150 RepID=UPI002AB49B40|nr:lanthionine synthetase C family protein [Aquimarina sp. 2201CG5-10]MDY8137085.1 lanthionine synthetase C family protein [Aquimarina sp. 2201CG5-10]
MNNNKISRKKLEKKLAEVYEITKNDFEKSKHVGVLSGISGVSLFQFYYAKFLDNDEYADVGAEVIAHTIERINSGYTYPTFCTGIAGAGWTIEFLNKEGFIEIDNDALLSQLDSFLHEVMKEDIKNEYYDFLHGALGYGYYFLKRYQNTKSPDLKNTYKEYLTFLITELKNSSRKGEKGIYWEYELSKTQGFRGANLSLSHGMASIINFLCRLYPYEDFKTSVEDLLKGTIEFVIHNKYKNSNNPSLFPSWIHDQMKEYATSRLAWCYGDLGMGISLWRAGKILKIKAYQELAIDVLKHSAKRRDREEARIQDAGLCHGAYGVVTIFNYIYQETKDPLFKETADFWMYEALEMDIHQESYAGYKQWRGDLEEWHNEINLLEGITGIGLALLSYLAPEEANWDECLMIH